MIVLQSFHLFETRFITEKIFFILIVRRLVIVANDRIIIIINAYTVRPRPLRCCFDAAATAATVVSDDVTTIRGV